MFKFKSLFKEQGTYSIAGKVYDFNDGEVITTDIRVAERLRISSSFKEIKINNLQSSIDKKKELDNLKEYAKNLNLSFHPNISLEKLQDKVDEFLRDE